MMCWSFSRSPEIGVEGGQENVNRTQDTTKSIDETVLPSLESHGLESTTEKPRSKSHASID